ncbi:uncharacterized protein LOC143562566 isoform X2 [Bidens hawaiensis]|uniref:uncharacterized protein LOC143562566 isoform X2 n=1 Tax=Bidens hawaiensis TaxID=980011 RepID=UPI00404AB9DE
MNRATKLALINLNINNNYPLYIKASCFHSTPVLDRRRKTHWESIGRSGRSSSRRPNFNGRQQRKYYAKQEMLRNVNAFAENIFQGRHERDEYKPSSRSWYKNNGPRRFYGPWPNPKGANGWAHKKGFQFYEEDEEVETIFRSAFGINAGFYYWSFINDEPPRNSSGYYSNNNNRDSWKWRRQFESDEDDDEDEDDELERVETDLRKDRIALGLSGSGPLSIEDVKNAYRACALKWHPDRHNGSSKDIAEEKFKVCSAAYQSLCDKLAPN